LYCALRTTDLTHADSVHAANTLPHWSLIFSSALPSFSCSEGTTIMTFKTHIASAALAITLSLPVKSAIADVVAVVSSMSAITSLSNGQVTDIFLGKVSRFPNGALAIPIDQAQGSQVREEFYAAYAGKSSAQIMSYWAKIIFTGRGQPPKAAASSSEVRKLLAANPQAISYVERSEVDSTVRVLVAL
jgi:ABC-type phosphate transport system substrate-binding protein